MEPFTTLMGAHVVPVLERILRRAQDWDFNVFELEQESQGNPLSVISFFLLNQASSPAAAPTVAGWRFNPV